MVVVLEAAVQVVYRSNVLEKILVGGSAESVLPVSLGPYNVTVGAGGGAINRYFWK